MKTIDKLTQASNRARREQERRYGEIARQRVLRQRRAEELRKAREILDAQAVVEAHERFTAEVRKEIEGALAGRRAKTLERTADSFISGGRRAAGVEDKAAERRAKLRKETDELLAEIKADMEAEDERRREAGAWTASEVDALLRKWEKS